MSFKFDIGDHVRVLSLYKGGNITGIITKQFKGSTQASNYYHFKMPNGELNMDGYFENALDFANTWHEECQFAVQVLGEEYFE